jgi:phosphoglycerol transferase
MAGAAFGMTVLYTASIANLGPNEGLRLHLRYYDFTFPLFYIAVAAQLGRRNAAALGLRTALAVVLGAASAYALFKLPLAYSLNYIDSPDLLPVVQHNAGTALLLVCELGLLALWVRRQDQAAAAFIFAFLPLSMLGAEIVIRHVLHETGRVNSFDLAGDYARRHLNLAERQSLCIAGSELALLMRAKFHVDTVESTLLDLPEGAPLDAALIPRQRQWLLLIGKHALPAVLVPSVSTADFKLIHIGTGYRRLGESELSKPLEGTPLAAVEGLSVVESWGRWSVDGEVRLHFRAPLPRRLAMVLTGRSFGPNVDQAFTVHVGQASASFHIGATEREVFLSLPNDGQQTVITIDIPKPTSPYELGQSIDRRKLGLGLVKVEIGISEP